MGYVGLPTMVSAADAGFSHLGHIIENTVVTSALHEKLAKLEYISFADDKTLLELVQVEGPAVVSTAVRFGTTRLIDNIVLGS